MISLNVFVYIYYLFTLFYWGSALYQKINPTNNIKLFHICGFVLLGILSGVSITYVLAVLFHSIVIAVLVWCLLISFLFLHIRLKNLKQLTVNFEEVIIFCASVAFSLYIMIKTFRTTPFGDFYIARHVIFDFAHLLSIIRSFSFGNNIPYQSPFVSETQHIYHYIFAFFSSIGEVFGIPITWAVNIPSVVGMVLMVLMVFGLVTQYWKMPKIIGVLALFAATFQSSIGIFSVVWNLFKGGEAIKNFWLLPDYPFKGPFDGSVISIFTTLNVFVNQRHLSFTIAFIILLFLLISLRLTKQSVMLLGIVSGLSVIWHVSLLPIIIFCVIVQFIRIRNLNALIWYILGVFIGSAHFIVHWFPTLLLLRDTYFRIPSEITESVSNQGLFWVANFIVQNLGVYLLFIFVGFFSLRKYLNFLSVPIIIFLSYFFFQLFNGNIDQKSYSITLVFLKLIGILGIYVLWKYRHLRVVIGCIFALSVSSGVLDLLSIKNDYMLVVKDYSTSRLMKEIQKTDNESIYTSHEEMFDPVLLAGRRTYFGFFKQALFYDEELEYRRRQMNEKRIDNTITHILITKVENKIRTNYFTIQDIPKEFSLVFEDEEYVLFKKQKTSL